VFIVNLEENLNNLKNLYETTIKCIFDSVDLCPIALREIFSFIKQNTQAHLKTDDHSVGTTAVTGFIFLRFFVPAIMTPKLFGLLTDYATGNSEITFKLIATMIQKLANLTLFEPRDLHLDKLNDLLERDKEKMKQFVDEISTPLETLTCTMQVHPQIDLPHALARMCRYISDSIILLEQAIPDKHAVKFIAELSILSDEMEFLGKKFKADQKKRRAETRATNQATEEQWKRKRSISIGRRKEKVVSKEVPFPEFNTVIPYNKGDVPEHVDEYVLHLLEALEQAKRAYDYLLVSKKK